MKIQSSNMKKQVKYAKQMSRTHKSWPRLKKTPFQKPTLLPCPKQHRFRHYGSPVKSRGLPSTMRSIQAVVESKVLVQPHEECQMLTPTLQATHTIPIPIPRKAFQDLGGRRDEKDDRQIRPRTPVSLTSMPMTIFRELLAQAEAQLRDSK